MLISVSEVRDITTCGLPFVQIKKKIEQIVIIIKKDETSLYNVRVMQAHSGKAPNEFYLISVMLTQVMILNSCTTAEPNSIIDLKVSLDLQS